MRKLSLAALAVLALALPGTVAAQNPQATMTVTATVLSPLTVSVGQTLDFGDVLPGIAQSIASGDANAGRFEITGNPGSEVQLTFTALPANLTDGGNSMAITWSAGYGVASTSQDGTFTPAAGTAQYLEGATGNLFVFLGGAFTPATNQPAGTYTADVTLQVSYTGS
jgi:hypothetical protein